MNSQFTKPLAIASIILATGLAGCGTLGDITRSVANGMTPRPDEYKDLEIGMARADVDDLASEYRRLDDAEKIKQAPVALPDKVEVYETRLHRQMVMNPEENPDAEGVDIQFEVLLAFETNEAGEQSLIAKRIGADTVTTGNSVGHLECFPSDHFLCAGELSDWKDY